MMIIIIIVIIIIIDIHEMPIYCTNYLTCDIILSRNDFLPKKIAF